MRKRTADADGGRRMAKEIKININQEINKNMKNYNKNIIKKIKEILKIIKVQLRPCTTVKW